MPWFPDLFSADALTRIEARRHPERVEKVAFFDGVMTAEVDALVGSFAGAPSLDHPTRGRIEGAEAFAQYARDTKAWLEERDAVVEDVTVTVTPGRSIEEVVVHLDGGGDPLDLPVAIVNDRDPDGRIVRQRMYCGSTG